MSNNLLLIEDDRFVLSITGDGKKLVLEDKHTPSFLETIYIYKR